jgi:hypothetical protein
MNPKQLTVSDAEYVAFMRRLEKEIATTNEIIKNPKRRCDMTNEESRFQWSTEGSTVVYSNRKDNRILYTISELDVSIFVVSRIGESLPLAGFVTKQSAMKYIEDLCKIMPPRD